LIGFRDSVAFNHQGAEGGIVKKCPVVKLSASQRPHEVTQHPGGSDDENGNDPAQQYGPPQVARTKGRAFPPDAAMRKP
jgi:hypothetical protein